MNEHDEHYDDSEDWGPSKSQRKRDSEALQKLGLAIVELSDSQYRKIPLEGPLKEAIDLARRLNVREGRRRQLQYIGKLMRSADVEPLREALAKIQGQSARETGQLHLLERWRERLLEDENGDALTEFRTLYPHADLQQLRSLIRQSQKEKDQGQPPKSSRQLFKTLREILEHPGED